jgi:hypothetical protein
MKKNGNLSIPRQAELRWAAGGRKQVGRETTLLPIFMIRIRNSLERAIWQTFSPSGASYDASSPQQGQDGRLGSRSGELSQSSAALLFSVF